MLSLFLRASFPSQPKDYSIKMNKKERRLAMATAFQSAAADLMVVESLEGEVGECKVFLSNHLNVKPI